MKVKVELELDEDMIANLALMGGYLGHSIAIERAAEDIRAILREKMLSIPVKHGKLRVGLANNESKTAWIEFQRDWSSVSADLALVDTEFGGDDKDDLTILTYSERKKISRLCRFSLLVNPKKLYNKYIRWCNISIG